MGHFWLFLCQFLVLKKTKKAFLNFQKKNNNYIKMINLRLPILNLIFIFVTITSSNLFKNIVHFFEVKMMQLVGDFFPKKNNQKYSVHIWNEEGMVEVENFQFFQIFIKISQKSKWTGKMLKFLSLNCFIVVWKLNFQASGLFILKSLLVQKICLNIQSWKYWCVEMFQM